MKAAKIINAFYIGSEFPEYFGIPIQVRDDYSVVNNPSYEIKFDGENYWHDNVDESDWQLKQPKQKPVL